MSPPFFPPREQRLKGIGLALMAYLMFTGIDVSAKWLAVLGMAAVQIVFLRYAGHLVLVALVHLPRHGPGMFRTANLRLQLLRAATLLVASGCNFVALRYLPLTVTGAIAFTVPLLVSALSVPLLGESVGWRRWTAIVIGFAGVLVIVRPGTEAFHPAALLCLVAAASTALYLIFTRRVAGTDSAATSQFYVGIIAALALLPFAVANWSWPQQPGDWAAFFAIGLFGFLGHQLITMASGMAPAAVLAPFSYLQIIFMALAGWIVFSQLPDMWLYVGAPIVIASGLYIWWRERVLARPAFPLAEQP